MKEKFLKFRCEKLNQIVVDFKEYFLIQVNIAPIVLIINVELHNFRGQGSILYAFPLLFNLN